MKFAIGTRLKNYLFLHFFPVHFIYSAFLQLFRPKLHLNAFKTFFKPFSIQFQALLFGKKRKHPA